MNVWQRSRYQASLEGLVALLDLEELDRDLYRGRNPEGDDLPVLYGGQVAAQAVKAAAGTVPEGSVPHSLHGYFLRPGQVDRPIILRVSRDRDGRSFSARHVVALQDAQVILSLSVSFHRPEPGVVFEVPGPTDVPEPSSLEPLGDRSMMRRWTKIFDFRLASMEPSGQPASERSVPTRMWVRTTGPIGADPVLHACILTYVSDLNSGFGGLDLPIEPPAGGPSLDHAMWLHRPVDVQDWFLFDLEPVVAAGGRGFYHGAIYDRGGSRCASISQELLTRSPRSR